MNQNIQSIGFEDVDYVPNLEITMDFLSLDVLPMPDFDREGRLSVWRGLDGERVGIADFLEGEYLVAFFGSWRAWEAINSF